MAELDTAQRPAPTAFRLESAARLVALAGGIVMLAAAILVCVSVSLRWATGDTVPGDYEWVQIAVAIAAFCFLPYCQLRGGNIVVTTFTTRLSARAQAWLDRLWDLVAAAFAGLIAWRLGLGAFEAIGNKTTTMVVGFPIGWSIAVTSGLAAFLAAAAVVTALRLRRTRP